MALRWYAAKTDPLKEYAARDQLEAARVEVLLPCVQTLPPRRGRTDRPLFPGYLFLKWDLEEEGWGVSHGFPDCVRLVAFDGVVPAVSDDVISKLARLVEGINQRGATTFPFRPGDKVMMNIGALTSVAEVIEERKSGRLQVLVEFLGRLVHADVCRDDVQPMTGDQSLEDWKNWPPRRTRGNRRWVGGYGLRAFNGSSGPNYQLHNWPPSS